jgi:hypothetical protein
MNAAAETSEAMSEEFWAGFWDGAGSGETATSSCAGNDDRCIYCDFFGEDDCRSQLEASRDAIDAMIDAVGGIGADELVEAFKRSRHLRRIHRAAEAALMERGDLA